MSGTRSIGNRGDDKRGAVAASAPRSGVDRQREEFGGFSWGSAFFGWLVAVGLAALLTALLSAIGTAIGLTELTGDEAENAADTIGIVGGILLLAVLALAYYCGGYVAGRLARFDGKRQGLGVWLFSLLITIALAAAAVVLGSEYNLLSQLNLPRIPVDEGALTTGGIIALAATLLVTLGAAIAGGQVGERFHRKVDRVAGDRVTA
jgi:MFS family permease